MIFFLCQRAFPAKAIDIYFFFVQNQIPAKSLETVKFMLFSRPWKLSWNHIFFAAVETAQKLSFVPKLWSAKLISSSQTRAHCSKWSKYTFCPIFFTYAWLKSLSQFSLPRNSTEKFGLNFYFCAKISLCSQSANFFWWRNFFWSRFTFWTFQWKCRHFWVRWWRPKLNWKDSYQTWDLGSQFIGLADNSDN